MRLTHPGPAALGTLVAAAALAALAGSPEPPPAPDLAAVAVAAPCDPDGVTVVWRPAFAAGLGAYAIPALDLAGLDPACAGVEVVLRDAGGASLGRAVADPAAAGLARVRFDPPVPARPITAIEVGASDTAPAVVVAGGGTYPRRGGERVTFAFAGAATRAGGQAFRWGIATRVRLRAVLAGAVRVPCPAGVPPGPAPATRGPEPVPACARLTGEAALDRWDAAARRWRTARTRVPVALLVLDGRARAGGAPRPDALALELPAGLADDGPVPLTAGRVDLR